MHQLVQFEVKFSAERQEFLAEVLSGLASSQKSIPSRFFYDARGSELFEEITRLPEYYPTRTEIALLKSIAGELASLIPRHAAVIEFGSGSSRKTELLLAALHKPSAYIPIEISAAALFPAASRIKRIFPHVGVYPTLAGFHDIASLTLPLTSPFYLGFFPGSTIGNLTGTEAVDFLRSARALLGENAALLIGADLEKSLDILLPAYNDAQGVTAAFNLNLLARINRELGGTFDLRAFDHMALYDQAHRRIEMHLRSRRFQKAYVDGRAFSFSEGETIHTENSHKYTISGFHALALEGGWKAVKTWADENNLFSLHMLV